MKDTLYRPHVLGGARCDKSALLSESPHVSSGTGIKARPAQPQCMQRAIYYHRSAIHLWCHHTDEGYVFLIYL